MIDLTTSPPPEFVTPKKPVGGTLMAFATIPCEPELAFRCMIPRASSKGDTMPAVPQPQISCACSAERDVKVVFCGADTTKIIAGTGPWKSLISAGSATPAKLGQFFQKMSEGPTSAAWVPASVQLDFVTL